MTKIIASLASMAVLGVGSTACSQHSGHDSGNAAHAGATARTVEIAVTPEGFTPAEIHVKRGESRKLVVTRKTDKTCAKEIVVKGLGIRAALPLGEPVTVEITPSSSGNLRYACGMDMVSGVIVVD